MMHCTTNLCSTQACALNQSLPAATSQYAQVLLNSDATKRAPERSLYCTVRTAAVQRGYAQFCVGLRSISARRQHVHDTLAHPPCPSTNARPPPSAASHRQAPPEGRMTNRITSPILYKRAYAQRYQIIEQQGFGHRTGKHARASKAACIQLDPAAGIDDGKPDRNVGNTIPDSHTRKDSAENSVFTKMVGDEPEMVGMVNGGNPQESSARSDPGSTEQLVDKICHNFGELWPKPKANGQIEIQELGGQQGPGYGLVFGTRGNIPSEELTLALKSAGGPPTGSASASSFASRASLIGCPVR